MVTYAQQISRRKTISRNPIAVTVRDALLPIFLRKAATDQTTRWLYDHQTDATTSHTSSPWASHRLHIGFTAASQQRSSRDGK